MVRQSFRYLQTIIDLQNSIDDGGIGSEDFAEKDKARSRCHDATIDSINIWTKSLHRNGIDNSFMSGISSNPPVRSVYGAFAVGLAFWIYIQMEILTWKSIVYSRFGFIRF